MKKISLLLTMLATVLLSSCLKDGKVNFAPGTSPMVTQWATAAIGDAPTNGVGELYRTYARAYPIVQSVTMNLQVSITGTDPATEDMTVGVGVDPAALTAFVAAHGGSNNLLPTTFYTMPSTVTIVKGTRTATVPVVMNTTLFNPALTYRFPVKITSTSKGEISGNYGTVIYNIQVKNKYDGVYSLEGLTVSPDRTNVYTAGPWKWPGNINLVTTGASSLALYDATYNWGGGESQRILPLNGSLTAGVGFGSTWSHYTFDATDKLIEVKNVFVNPSNGRALAIDPSYADNKYDPATKTITMRFFFTQPGFATTTVTYKFVYVKSR